MNAGVELSGARAPGRPRDPRVDRDILAATLELLAEDGFDGLSIEAVAARAGVGKTTVYRRWPSKIPLAVDALTGMKAPTPAAIPDDITTREALVHAMSGFTKPHEGSATRLLAGLVDAMSRNEELAAAVRSVLVAERERGLLAVIERGKARGEIRPDVDARVMIDLLGGPVVLRRLITGDPVNQRLAHAIVELVMDGAAPSA
ncbi:MAG: TetR/AcrR family transcriptional regulator [Actinomycetota bacterium]